MSISSDLHYITTRHCIEAVLTMKLVRYGRTILTILDALESMHCGSSTKGYIGGVSRCDVVAFCVR